MTQAEVQDTTDEVAAQDADDIDALARRQAAEDLHTILALSEGRRLLWNILTRGRIFETSFTGNSNWCVFNEGRRNFGLELLAWIQEADSKAWVMMQDEARKLADRRGDT